MTETSCKTASSALSSTRCYTHSAHDVADFYDVAERHPRGTTWRTWTWVQLSSINIGHRPRPQGKGGTRSWSYLYRFKNYSQQPQRFCIITIIHAYLSISTNVIILLQ